MSLNPSNLVVFVVFAAFDARGQVALLAILLEAEIALHEIDESPHCLLANSSAIQEPGRSASRAALLMGSATTDRCDSAGEMSKAGVA